MSAKNPKAGRGPCPCCGESVLFRKSPTSGRFTFSCDACDMSGFSEPGGAAHRKWAAAMKPEPGAEPAPAPSPAPSPAPAPKARHDPLAFLSAGQQ